MAEADLPTRWARFRILGFTGPGATPEAPPEEAVVLRLGDLGEAPLLRIHSQCLTGDVFASLRCDCRQQLEMALEAIAAAGAGLLLYEQKEGRGIGLMNKLRAYALQDQGADTVEANRMLGFGADERDYAFAAAILRHLGVRQVRLLSNNPEKIAALEQAGIRVAERVPCQPTPASEARDYLRVKKEKLGHLLG